MVKTYSLARDCNTKLSDSFAVREFRCGDGSDKILIDSNLVSLLQKIRDFFNVPITINSAYRNAAYNRKIGGASKSQHVQGTAADIVVHGVSSLKVAQYAEYLGAGGVGWYKTFTHVDVRVANSRWNQTSGRQVAVATFGGQDQFRSSDPPEREGEMTAEEVRKIVKEEIEKTLLGEGTIAQIWAETEWAEATETGITDGSRPEGYAKRDEVAAMLIRAIAREK